ncbi:MAG: TonB-dependent receptor, partial [Candidatus Acidiferrales bacterium]
ISSLFDFIGSAELADQFTPGLLPTDRVHIVNFYGSYMINSGWANGLNLGSNLRVQSGTPITRYLAHPAYFNAGEIPSGGRGALGKTRVAGVWDLHFDYPWEITERYRLRGALDFFNVLNAKRITTVDQFAELGGPAPNPDFLTPNSYQTPFAVRFALRFEW